MNYNARAYQYEEDILSGKRTAGRLLKLAIERQRRDLVELTKKGYTFSHEHGQHILDFSGLLMIGPETPFELMDFNLWELYVFYGWLRPDGTRRFKTRYKCCARKNAKTPLESYQYLYHIGIPHLDKKPEVYICATKEEQSKIAFNDARSIIENSPELEGLFKVTSTSISCSATGGKICFLTSNPKTADGTRPSFATIEEYHEWDNTDMVSKQTTGMVHRKERILSYVTTRGSHKDGYPCYESERRVFIPILEGSVIDDSVFVVIYSQDSEDEFYKPETWGKSNPMLEEKNGILTLGTLIEMRDQAILEGEEKVVSFKTLNLNWWCDAAKSYIDDESWMKSPSGVFDIEELKGRECFVGLDMADSDDYCAAAFMFPPVEWRNFEARQKKKDEDIFRRSAMRCDGEFKVLWLFWIPGDTVTKRTKKGQYTLRDWIKEGFVKVCPDSNVIDPRIIENDILAFADNFKVKFLWYDKWNATTTALKLQEDGLDTYSIPQTMAYLSEPTKDFKKLVITQRLNHNNNPVARWMMRNAVPISDTNGNTKLTKDPKRCVDKIDGIVAAIMALAAWMGYQNTRESVLARRGVRTL